MGFARNVGMATIKLIIFAIHVMQAVPPVPILPTALHVLMDTFGR
jgi:hypothetical protein